MTAMRGRVVVVAVPIAYVARNDRCRRRWPPTAPGNDLAGRSLQPTSNRSPSDPMRITNPALEARELRRGRWSKPLSSRRVANWLPIPCPVPGPRCLLQAGRRQRTGFRCSRARREIGRGRAERRRDAVRPRAECPPRRRRGGRGCPCDHGIAAGVARRGAVAGEIEDAHRPVVRWSAG